MTRKEYGRFSLATFGNRSSIINIYDPLNYQKIPKATISCRKLLKNPVIILNVKRIPNGFHTFLFCKVWRLARQDIYDDYYYYYYYGDDYELVSFLDPAWYPRYQPDKKQMKWNISRFHESIAWEIVKLFSTKAQFISEYRTPSVSTPQYY